LIAEEHHLSDTLDNLHACVQTSRDVSAQDAPQQSSRTFEDPNFANHDIISPITLHHANNSESTPHHEDLHNNDGNFPASSVPPYQGGSPGTGHWPQLNQLESFSTIDAASENQFFAAENSFVEGNLPHSFVNNNLSMLESIHNPDFVLPTPSAWSPQQTLSSPAADQSFMSYNNPYQMSPQAMVPSFYPHFPIQATLQRTPCPLCPQTFTRPSDLTRHYTSVHLGIKHHCFYPGCDNNRGNGYCRAEKLRTHQRERHGISWF
jgi:hypothetical protein